MEDQRGRDRWGSQLRRAMQAAIGQQLKTEFEPFEELTPDLIVLLRRMHEPKSETKQRGSD
jgi:hypothetical protein